MTAQLLTTKLYIPPARSELVSRPRLTERLNAGLDRKLTLVSASAGFGKTTLLSDWGQSCERPVAWVSLDEGDNDPLHFLSYVVAALQTIQAGLGETALAAFQSPQPPLIKPLLAALINEIADVPDALVLVLDDYHAITAPSIHEILAFLLDHVPPQMHLVIASRSDPPLPLARLRGRNQLNELREADLRFTAEEATIFLNQVMGLDLSAGNVAALEARAEGWVTGLQMAALSMQGLEDVSGFIKAFSGSHRYILDYLAEEVLQHQPQDVQDFMLQTSILDRLAGPLCDAVTGRDDSQVTLERLERANLFIIPLDGHRQWYRYHRLFADLLRVRLKQARPSLVSELHRGASAWYEQNGLTIEAVNHALAAKDFERAIRLFVENAWMMLTRGEMNTLLGWMDALPEDAALARPWIDIYRAWALVLSGQLDSFEPPLRRAEEILPALPVQSDADVAEAEAMRGAIVAARAHAARLRGDVRESIALSHQALEHLQEGELTWRLRSSATLNLGLTYWLSGDAAAMAEASAEAARVSQQAGDSYLALVALSILGQAQEVQGHLHQAAETYRRVLQLADEYGARRAPFVGLAHVGLAGPLLEWNDSAGAMRHVMEAIDLGKRGGLLDILEGAYQTLSMVLQAQGDVTGALEAVQEAKQLAQRYNLIQMVEQLKLFEVRLRLVQGDVASASRWAQESNLSANDTFDHTQRNHYMTLARVLVAQGKPTQALRLLKRLRENADAGGRTDQTIRALVLQALAFQAQGDAGRAIATLEEVLSLAEPEGYVRAFVNEGEPVTALLRKAASQGAVASYAKRLLAVLGAEREGVGKSPWPSRAATLPDSLSDRELEVLRLVADGLSNQEIADRLVIAVSTVKSHVNQILGKLDAKSRTQAAARARELGLL